MKSTYVYITLKGQAIPAGRLDMEAERGRTFARFRYGRRYLQRDDALSLDPIQLPLPRHPDQDFYTPEGFDLFSGIRDAAPDGWGRHLMDRAAGGLLNEFDYLVASGEDRVGALSFGPDLTGPKRLFPWHTEEPEETAGHTLNLSDLLKNVQSLETADDLPPEHRRFLVRGSSLGGARPKATTRHKDTLWIAKFSRSSDRYPVCRAEYAIMQLAKRLGLTVPDIDCVRVLDQDVYLIRRFDRGETNEKIPFISGLTLLGLHESESPTGSYTALAEALRRHGSRPDQDARELWQRMVLNILCNNTDDHLRNHGFLWDGRGWRLSPLYDVVPFPQVATERYLAIGVGREGRRATLDNALSEASAFGFSPTEATQKLQALKTIVQTQWQTLFWEAGLSQPDTARLASCFLAATYSTSHLD